MADVIVAAPGQLNGTGDRLAGFLKIFAGEIITAFDRATVVLDKSMSRTIESGKSASFPVFGRTSAAYLKPGGNLDDIRTNIQHAEKVIQIDGLLTASQIISDIDEALSHFDVRGEYSKQMGEALALAADSAILAEAAKLVVANAENIAGLGKGKVIQKNVATSADMGITESFGKALFQILLEAKAAMTKNRVPQTERYCFIDPDGHAALVASMVAINRDYGAIATITEANVLRIAGFDIIECPHLTDGGASTTNILQGSGHDFPPAYKAGGATPCSMVIMHRTAVGTVKLMDLGLEQARRAELQADMLVAKYAMGHGGLRPEAAFLGVVRPTA